MTPADTQRLKKENAQLKAALETHSVQMTGIFCSRGGVTVSLYPEQTCLLCDLPWKNNRVRYDGSLALDYAPRELELGETRLTLEPDGVVTLSGTMESLRIATGLRPLEETIAFDALDRVLFAACAGGLCACSLTKQREVFRYPTPGSCGAPLLFEQLHPDGEILPCVGISDGAGCYIALSRGTGEPLWRAQILGVPAGGAAHWSGYLFLTLRCAPCQALCLEARSGDLVWWNRGEGEALGGVIAQDAYCVLEKNGRWLRFSLADGERIA